MKVNVTGSLGNGVSAKDVTLSVIGKTGTAGGTGHVIEYAGSVIEGLSMEGRMTVCNMAIEGGARAGLIAPDHKTFDYVKGRNMSPKNSDWDKALIYWKSLFSDPGAHFDQILNLDGGDIAPVVTWGTSPEHVVAIDGVLPGPDSAQGEEDRRTLTLSDPTTRTILLHNWFLR